MDTCEHLHNWSQAEEIQGTEAEWPGLSAHYERVHHEIERLGGALGCEEASDALWNVLEGAFDDMAKVRARSVGEIVQKLRAAVIMTDEASHCTIRSLLESAMTDLTLHANAKYKEL